MLMLDEVLRAALRALPIKDGPFRATACGIGRIGAEPLHEPDHAHRMPFGLPHPAVGRFLLAGALRPSGRLLRLQVEPLDLSQIPIAQVPQPLQVPMEAPFTHGLTEPLLEDNKSPRGGTLPVMVHVQ